MKQYIDHLLTQTNISPKNICFYSFSLLDNNIHSCIEHYLSILPPQALYKQELYIFLDEVQHIPHRQETVKYYYDINPHIHFIISWSASLYVHKHTTESLAWRILDIYLPPLTRREYIHIQQNTQTIKKINLFEKNIVEHIHDLQQHYLIYHETYNTYMFQHEFPELIHQYDTQYIQQYITHSLIDKIFSKDIEYFDIRKKQDFYKLFQSLSQNIAQTLNKSLLGQDIAINTKTLEHYLTIQEQAYIISRLPIFHRSKRNQQKSFKKIYCTSTNMAVHSLWFSHVQDVRFKDFLWHVLENTVYNNLRSICNNITYRKQQQKEVDFILTQGEDIIPCEVKKKTTRKTKDLRHLLSFCKAQKINQAILIYGWMYQKTSIDTIIIHCIPYRVI